MTDSFEARGDFMAEANTDTDIHVIPDFSDAPVAAETSLDAVVAEPNGFVKLGLAKELLQAVADMGFTQPTAVQMATIPKAMQALDADVKADPKAKFTDLLVSSQTGSGKTAAFGVGLIETLSKNPAKKALILAPTRELVVQIAKELRSIAKNHRMRIYSIYGGQSMGPQIASLRQGFDIIVATPGRLLDHARRGTVNLLIVNCVVLDEADRMLDMGFKEDIDQILDQLNPKRQTMLFSATIDDRIKSLSGHYMGLPVLVEIGPKGKVESIEEQTIYLARREKPQKLAEILRNVSVSRAIIFVATKRAVEFVCRRLNRDGIPAHYLHGGKSQNQRERTMREFKEGRFRILVATDVAARGLHIDEVSHIINYDQANTEDTHTHRIGRTGRMGKEGKAITFMDTDAPPPYDYRNGGRRYGRRQSGNGREYGNGHGDGRRTEGPSSYRPRSRKGYDPYKSRIWDQ